METRSSAGKEKNQSLINLDARKGLEPVINSLLEHGQLRDCQSEFNTSVLPAKKRHYHEHRLVQELREADVRTANMHPVLPDLYTLLASVPDSNTYFTVLDLKEAFFCVPMDEQTLLISAFG